MGRIFNHHWKNEGSVHPLWEGWTHTWVLGYFGCISISNLQNFQHISASCFTCQCFLLCKKWSLMMSSWDQLYGLLLTAMRYVDILCDEKDLVEPLVCVCSHVQRHSEILGHWSILFLLHFEPKEGQTYAGQDWCESMDWPRMWHPGEIFGWHQGLERMVS